MTRIQRHSGDTAGGVLFIFLDGIGLAHEGSENPFSQGAMPTLEGLLGCPLVLNGSDATPGSLSPVRQTANPRQSTVVFRAVDACLGVPGLPQSATGQAALFTGLNAPALVGGHISAFPTTPLQELVAGHSLLKQAAEVGGRVIFANAHSEQFWELIREQKRRMGMSTRAALAAGAPIPTMEDLNEGRAILWDITHEVASSYLNYELPVVKPEVAGARLARLSLEYDLVLFESFLTDLAGHGRIEPNWVLARVDAFFSGVLDHLPEACTLVVCSDHGNLEDLSTKLHTTNPVPLVAAGPCARLFLEATAITDVTPAILAVLQGNR